METLTTAESRNARGDSSVLSYLIIQCLKNDRNDGLLCFVDLTVGCDIIAIRKGVKFFLGLGRKLRTYYICIIKSYQVCVGRINEGGT